MDTLQTERRDMTIKAKRLRREGYVTGNVFGHAIEGSIPVKIGKKEVEKLMKSSSIGSRIKLMVGTESYNVLIKDVQYNSMKSRYDEVDFQALVSGEMVQSVARVEILNRDEVKEGILHQELEEISYSALPENLIEEVVIDASALKLEQKVTVGDVEELKNPKIHLHTDADAIIAVVSRVHKPAEEEEPAAAPAEEAAPAEA